MVEDLIACSLAFFEKSDIDSVAEYIKYNIIKLINFLEENIYYSQYDYRAILDNREERIRKRAIRQREILEDEQKVEADEYNDFTTDITYDKLNSFFFIKSLFNLDGYPTAMLTNKELIKIMLSIYISVDPFKTVREHIKPNEDPILFNNDIDQRLRTYVSSYNRHNLNPYKITIKIDNSIISLDYKSKNASKSASKTYIIRDHDDDDNYTLYAYKIIYDLELEIDEDTSVYGAVYSGLGGNLNNYSIITDPVTNKKYNIRSKNGIRILKKYLKKVDV
jgi:hypothetical protein